MMVFNPSVSGGGSGETVEVVLGSIATGAQFYYTDENGELITITGPSSWNLLNPKTIRVLKGSVIAGNTNSNDYVWTCGSSSPSLVSGGWWSSSFAFLAENAGNVIIRTMLD